MVIKSGMKMTLSEPGKLSDVLRGRARNRAAS